MCSCKTSWRRHLLRVVPLLVMVALAGAVLLAGDRLDPETLVSYVPARPWLAAGVLVALFALKSLSVVFPTWILAVVSAQLFSLPAALGICAAGVAVEVSVPYWISRFSGAGTLERLVEKHPKVDAIRSFRLGGDFLFAFLTRIVGLFSCDLISMYMGAVKLPYLPYLLGSVCGFFPHVAAYALMGDAIADPTSPQFRLAVAVLAGLILLSSGACLLFQHHHPDKTARV